MRLFVDQDQTLADFEEAFKHFIGIKTYPYKDKFFELIAARTGFTEDKINEFWEIHFWAIIDTIPFYWENIPPMKDFPILWGFIKHYNPIVLTATRDHDVTRALAKRGKRKWIDKYMTPETQMILIPLDPVDHKVMDKAIYCKNKSDILIDDNKRNVEEWIKKGGKAIHHKTARTTITQLKQIFKELQNEKSESKKDSYENKQKTCQKESQSNGKRHCYI